MICDITCKYFDLIIIGAGGAGLMSALAAADCGQKNIAVLSKVLPTNSHTASAKGGINASLGNVTADDWRWHAYDTLKGSAYLADEEAVNILCQKASEAIIYLEKIGVAFSRGENNLIAQRAYGGQTLDYGKGGLAYRACYSKDKTGQTILHTLYQQALNRQILFLNDYFVIDLVVENEVCYGCLALDIDQGQLVILAAKSTILATGGYSQIYFNTTSSTICTGDGSALALKAGLPLKDMEFVQFHPTGIHNMGFLVTEAARGEGGYLLNKNHERFMAKYSPQMMELSSRDVISKAMAQEVLRGFGAGVNHDHLYLDLRHLPSEVIHQKLPGVYELVKKFLKIDVSQDLIPVSPSAHYAMGGVDCNIDCQVIEGLMAVGEVACVSVHGANRLGCNSLLDLIVFGKIAGEQVYLKNLQQPANQSSKFYEHKAQKLAQAKILNFQDKFAASASFKNQVSLANLKISLQKNNEIALGVVRNQQMIQQGIKNNYALWQNFLNYKISKQNLVWNDEVIAYYELEYLFLNSFAVANAALNRTESRGSHFRNDYPNIDKINFNAHSKISLQDYKTLAMSCDFVKLKNLIDEI